MNANHRATGFFMSRQVFSCNKENTPNERIASGFHFYRLNG